MICCKKFNSYRKVQYSGKYNMLTEAYDAMRDAKLTSEEYYDIIRNYDLYEEIYGKYKQRKK